MKTKNRILALAILIVSITAFTGCSKDNSVSPDQQEETFCWDCTITTMMYRSDLFERKGVDTFVICSMTQEEIDAMEERSSVVQYYETVKITNDVECVKK